MRDESGENLGFAFLETKRGEILIKRLGRGVAALRGNRARAFKEDMEALAFEEQQQPMARPTGNYKRGERKASQKAIPETHGNAQNLPRFEDSHRKDA